MPGARRDWNEIGYQIYLLAQDPAFVPQFKTIAGDLDIPEATLKMGMKREWGITGKDLPFVGEILREKINAEQLQEVEDAALVFIDKKETGEIDWREFLDYAEASKGLEDRLDLSQQIASVQLNTEEPIAVMFTGDWQLGCRFVDYDAWRKDMDYFLSTPNLYMVDLGDDRQNFKTASSLDLIWGQVLTPKQQALMLKSVVDELTRLEKLIAKVGGNHDLEFDERLFGEALASYLLEKMEAPFFRNRGLLKLTVGEQLYTILCFHKSRFKSFLRQTHGAMREYQLSYPADIVAGGHDHEPGLEHRYYYTLADQANMGFGGHSLLIKVGTYQSSDFGWKYFHNGGIPANYTVVFFPYEKKVVPFLNPKDAMAYIEGVKQKEALVVG